MDTLTNKHGWVAAFRLSDSKAFRAFADDFACRRPWLRFETEEVRGTETTLRSEGGRTKIWWIHRGEGEVYLPSGHRTKEGDGQRLPAEYRAEPMCEEFAAALAVVHDGLSGLNALARPAVKSILERRRQGSYIGDYANDLWKLEHVERPWTENVFVERALESLFRLCAASGYSVKASGSFERIMEGDQIILSADQELRVRGSFACLTLETSKKAHIPAPSVMRLRYLKDSSGGCNFDFDPFRRLPLTWQLSAPGEAGDGVNFANSHVVNIARETSPTHFHPQRPIGGGLPQHELYLVLDPAAYGLQTHGRSASIIVFPNLADLRRYEEIRLRPGDLVSIPPGVGHRGMDVFVNVITVPGFKPHNEYYLDADVARVSRGAAPVNADLVSLKNYEGLAALL